MEMRFTLKVIVMGRYLVKMLIIDALEQIRDLQRVFQFGQFVNQNSVAIETLRHANRRLLAPRQESIRICFLFLGFKKVMKI